MGFVRILALLSTRRHACIQGSSLRVEVCASGIVYLIGEKMDISYACTCRRASLVLGQSQGPISIPHLVMKT